MICVQDRAMHILIIFKQQVLGKYHLLTIQSPFPAVNVKIDESVLLVGKAYQAKK